MYLCIDEGSQVYHVMTMYKLGSHDTYININRYLYRHTHRHMHTATHMHTYTHANKKLHDHFLWIGFN